MRAAKERLTPAIGLALLWVGLAIAMSGTTFHLAPLVVAAAPAITGEERRLLWSGVGAAYAASVALVLALLGNLSGPSLLPYGGALLESTVAAVAGGVVGFTVARRMPPSRSR